MSATGSLSPGQKATLDSIFLLLRTTEPFLVLLAAKPVMEQTDKLQIDSTIKLMRYGQKRLVAAFPELQPLAEEWKARRGL